MRKKINYTQKDMADYLKISQPTYQRKETGDSQFLLEEIVAMIILFDCTFSEIFGELIYYYEN